MIGTISFDSTYSTATADADLAERAFTAFEKDLYQIRESALETINADTLFKTYKNTNLNLVPLIDGNTRKVYVLTGTDQKDVVIFGNDYLLEFDKNNRLTGRKRLHHNIIPVNYGKQGDEEIESSMHSHSPETGDYITATDICTLMLYEKLTKWKQHTVVSKKYFNTWNCRTDELLVLSMDVIDKIYKDQEKKDNE